jgi:glutamine amidotransferase
VKVRVAVIDYGMGNLHSVASALQHVGAGEVVVTHDAELIRKADRVVFPGVGAIRDCMAEIRRLKCDELLAQALTEQQVPVLAICVGLQALMDRSQGKRRRGLPRHYSRRGTLLRQPARGCCGPAP